MSRPVALPLWPLALGAGLLPALAALLALWLSIGEGWVPACNPFLEGCVSVSRAARHGLANHVFRALMLPSATLQALVWLLAAHWLRGALGPRPSLRWLAPLGVVAAVALVAYATFLGTEGNTYRWLRQYGTVGYFGCTCLNLLIAGGNVQKLGHHRHPGRRALPRALEGAMLALAGTLVTLGLVNAVAGAVLDEPLVGQVQNVAEWWGSLIFVLGYLALAAMWWRLGLCVTLASRPPP